MDCNERRYLGKISEFMEDEEKKKKIFKTIELLCWYYELCITRPGCEIEYVLEQFEEDEVVALIRGAWAIYKHNIWDFAKGSPYESRNNFVEYCIETESDVLIQYEYFLVGKTFLVMEENWGSYYTLNFGEDEHLSGFPLFMGTFFPYKYKREVEKFVTETLEKISFDEMKKREEELQESDKRLSQYIIYRNMQIEIVKQYYQKYHIAIESDKIPIIDKYITKETDKTIQELISQLDFRDVCLLTMILSSDADYRIFRNVTNRYNTELKEDVEYMYQVHLEDPRTIELDIQEAINNVVKVIT